MSPKTLLVSTVEELLVPKKNKNMRGLLSFAVCHTTRARATTHDPHLGGVARRTCGSFPPEDSVAMRCHTTLEQRHRRINDEQAHRRNPMSE
mmetsp:Transcript_27153/g.56891  ORF Transcript_27153/g.56891 Transcript_27153/m.56891 type:complete len:92 (+) Transcript_27153:3648-3923(+)